MKKHQVLELFKSANIEVLNIWEIPSRYWPSVCENECKAHPWWLVKTQKGLIEIGRCFEDIKMDWKDTGIRMDVIDSSVPKGSDWVQVEYIDDIHRCLERLSTEINRVDSISNQPTQSVSLEAHPKFEEFIRTFWREIHQFEDVFPNELPNPLPLEIRATLERTIHLLKN